MIAALRPAAAFNAAFATSLTQALPVKQQAYKTHTHSHRTLASLVRDSASDVASARVYSVGHALSALQMEESNARQV